MRLKKSVWQSIDDVMRKVLFVHNGPLYRSSDGGVYGSHFSEAIKQRYLQLGDHVTFLMREELLVDDPSRYSKIEPSQFSFVPVPNLMSLFGCALNHRAAMDIIAREVKEADVIVARIPSLTSRLALNHARLLDKPCLVECVACNWDALWNHHWKAKIAAPWYYFAQKRVLWDASDVVYVTEEFLQSRYPTKGKSVIISNVDIPTPSPEKLNQRLRHIEDNAEKARSLKLVTVADVGVPYKGQADVIKALPKLSEQGVSAEYHLVGGGDQTRMRALARRLTLEDRVVFHGALEHSNVLTLLQTMDLYIQPSRQEGLPRAMIEAMSCGLPCAGAQTGGIPELISPEFIFSAGNIEQMVKVIAALSKSTIQKTEARKNFDRAKDYGRGILEERRANFYEQFLKEKLS